MKKSPLTAELSAHGTPRRWFVEAIDADGDVEAAVFAGPGAKARAIEYAAAKYASYEVDK
jgi:hypothetical protein